MHGMIASAVPLQKIVPKTENIVKFNREFDPVDVELSESKFNQNSGGVSF